MDVALPRILPSLLSEVAQETQAGGSPETHTHTTPHHGNSFQFRPRARQAGAINAAMNSAVWQGSQGWHRDGGV